MKKRFLTVSAYLLAMTPALAQDIAAGAAQVEAAAQEITTMYATISTLIFAIAAIIALVGAIKIFMAWNSGERDVQKMVIGWFGACIFLVAIGSVIEGFFGVA